MDDRDFWDDWPEDNEEEDDLSPAERAILDELGLDDFDSLTLEFDHVNVDDIAGTRFTSFMDAIFYLYDGGIIQIFGVTYIPDEDMFAIVRDYPE